MRYRLAPLAALLLVATASHADEPGVGARLERRGDEIMVCGQLFHAGTPVVLWTDPGGYDAYRVDRRFVPADEANWAATEKAKALRSPVRFGSRARLLPPEKAEVVRGGGWDLPTLQSIVDQFVIHFDACGTAQKCFEVLHDQRGLSVHFMLDLDGTIYQTLDLKEGASHATIANARSVGIEIANVGTSATSGESDRLGRWYAKDADGHTRITLPTSPEQAGIRNPAAPLRPIRDEPVVGVVQGQEYRQYDLTAAQYEALIKLTATLCTIFPKIPCDYPRDSSGALIPRKLSETAYPEYHGILGHYHVQLNKNDPGPAFQWDRLIDGSRALLKK